MLVFNWGIFWAVLFASLIASVVRAESADLISSIEIGKLTGSWD